MKLHIHLFGLLSRHVPGYDRVAGLNVEIEDGSTPADLLAHLKIPPEQGAIVFTKGKSLGLDEPIAPNSHLKIFQIVHGG